MESFIPLYPKLSTGNYCDLLGIGVSCANEVAFESYYSLYDLSGRVGWGSG